MLNYCYCCIVFKIFKIIKEKFIFKKNFFYFLNLIIIIKKKGPIYHCPRPLVSYRSHCLPHCDYTHYHTRCSPCYTPTLTASTVAAIAASASLSSDLALCRTISKKNAEIEDLSIKYKTDVTHLEYELNETNLKNDELQATLVKYI
jgi:hypothetical protein